MEVIVVSTHEFDNGSVIAVIDSMDKLKSVLQDYFGNHKVLKIKPIDQFYSVKVNAEGLGGKIETSSLWCEPFTINEI